MKPLPPNWSSTIANTTLDLALNAHKNALPAQTLQAHMELLARAVKELQAEVVALKKAAAP